MFPRCVWDDDHSPVPAWRDFRTHFEGLLSRAPPITKELNRIRVADINFGVNNSQYAWLTFLDVPMLIVSLRLYAFAG
jgi:hypothetical protein